MNKAVSTFIVLTFLVLGLAVAASDSAQAKRYRFMCQGDHLHYGSSTGQASRRRALREAVYDWAGFTAFEYGDNFAHWSIAKNKRVGCNRASGGWSCSIEATPCRRNR